MIKVVCFDLGGTLLESDQPGFCTRISAALGISINDMRPQLGRHFLTRERAQAEALEEFCAEMKVEGVGRLASALETPPRRVSLYADALHALDALRGYRLGVISNVTPWESADLAALGIGHYFECVLYSFKCGLTKPDARVFREAERRLDAPPSQSVFVGDSPISDVRGAQEAGWRAVYLRRPTPFRASPRVEADAVIESLAELPGVLREF